MTREDQLASLMKQIAEERLKLVPTSINESLTAIAYLQAGMAALQGSLNLLIAFITSTPDSKKAFRDFVKLAANAEVQKENLEMYRTARIMDLMYPETDDPPSPDKQKGQHQSSPSLGDNVILFPGFPRTDPKK
jgi:hypothetical protein